MSTFDKKYFQKMMFSDEQINRYFQNALRDMKIAQKDAISEVRFTYSYQALIKIGITLIARKGGVKVRSIPGHHIKVLTKMSELLNHADILRLEMPCV